MMRPVDHGPSGPTQLHLGSIGRHLRQISVSTVLNRRQAHPSTLRLVSAIERGIVSCSPSTFAHWNQILSGGAAPRGNGGSGGTCRLDAAMDVGWFVRSLELLPRTPESRSSGWRTPYETPSYAVRQRHRPHDLVRQRVHAPRGRARTYRALRRVIS